jgi:hypothetical protein
MWACSLEENLLGCILTLSALGTTLGRRASLGGSYTPPVSGAGARGRVPRPRRMSSWAAAHEIHCVCFFLFF